MNGGRRLEHGEGDREFAVDAVAVGAVSAAICAAGDRPWFMTGLVPAVLVLRCAARFRLNRAGWRERRGEIAFLALCAVLGGFNDWNSVVRHRIYDYDVPALFPHWTTVPEWMLLYWGMVLRFFATLALWSRLDPPAHPEGSVYLGAHVLHSSRLRVAILLGSVLVTRQFIYRNYLDPLLSWLPFAIAIGACVGLLRPNRHDRRLAGLLMLGGPVIEILYIQVGKLHHYHLGWLGGVPLWIVLWWGLAILVWKDVSGRLAGLLRGTSPHAACS